MLNRILCLFSGLPSHRGLSEHPHSRLSVPAGAHQTETLGTVSANSRCVSATSMNNETYISSAVRSVLKLFLLLSELKRFLKTSLRQQQI